MNDWKTKRDKDRERVVAVVGEPPQDGWRHFRCPLCERRGYSPDARGALSVSSSGFYECHRCAARGWLKERPREYMGPLVPDEEAPVSLNVDRPESFWLLSAREGSQLLTDAYRYLTEVRGLFGNVLVRAQVGACVAGYYADRIIVPIFARDVVGPRTPWPLNADGSVTVNINGPDWAGDWAGFVARSWVPGAAKPYLYPQGMNRAQLLYGWGSLPIVRDTAPPLFVVEGVFDALALAPHAVALLGKPSRAQVAALCTSKRPVAVCLDGDALDEGWALAQILRLHGVRAGSIKLPPCADPDEIPYDVLVKASEKCIGQSEMVEI